MKKKLDASSPFGCDLNVAASSFCASQIKPAHVLVKVEGQSFNGMVSPKRQKVYSSAAEGCSDTTPVSELGSYIGGICPESVLRSLAMTYENIPSIIRKRTSSKAGSANFCDSAQTPEAERVISLDNLSLNQGFVPFLPRPNTKAIAKSLEGCME